MTDSTVVFDHSKPPYHGLSVNALDWMAGEQSIEDWLASIVLST
jgi:hypothetical protein